MLNQFQSFNLINIVDIIVVAFVAYKLSMLIKGTRAVQLIKGLVVLLIIATLSDWLGLYTIHWLLKNTLTMVVVALPVVFQPELRRALERLGRGKLFVPTMDSLSNEDARKLVDEISRAVQVMAKNKVGSLIIVEQEMGINEYIESGTEIDGIISKELLVNIFTDKAPLHDGAVILRDGRLIAAGCFLPLSDNIYLRKEFGTRHRAALGITEISDAMAIIVSEETGKLSIALDGKITIDTDLNNLATMLFKTLKPKTTNSFWGRRSS
jgi:diadenylate cyclase